MSSDDAVFGEVEALQHAWRLDEADALLVARSGELRDRARFHHRRSILAMQRGLVAPAFEQAALAEAIAPMHRAVRHHGLTLEKLHPAQDPSRFLGRHRAFGADFSGEEARLRAELPQASGRGGPLRVGYVTPDAHLAMARFIDCLRTRHDPARVAASFYYAFPVDLGDLQRRFPGVRHVALAGLSSAQVAERLAIDRLDVAIDLAGHGAGNQLPALMRRPARVQATWLDYVATTGVPSIDYRICDAVTDPPGAERWSTERPLRLPVAAWCYAPHPDAPAIEAVDPGRPLQLGSCCVPLKLTPETLRLWAEVLQALPQARLRLVGVPEGMARERVRAAFDGIDASRLEIEGRLAMPAYYRAVASFDIALDPLPFSGATTTLDCLWQGVPVVALRGSLPHARSSASILQHAGLGAWVADDGPGYVAAVVALAADLDARTRFRAEARPRLAANALFDAGRFMPRLEDALHEMAAAADSTRGASRPARGDDLHAEALAAEVLSQRRGGDADASERALDDVLRQSPTHRDARRAYWALVRARAPAVDPRVDVTLDAQVVVLGGAARARRLPAGRGASIDIALPTAQAVLDGVRARAAHDWVLLADAACVDWWMLSPDGLREAMQDADVVGAFGEALDSGVELGGLRMCTDGTRWIGTAWPFPAERSRARHVHGNWLLVRTSLLRSLSATSPAGVPVDAASAILALADAAASAGARCMVAPQLLGIDADEPLRDAAWRLGLHARCAARDGAPRSRIDVGRMFGAPDPASAAMLARALFAPGRP
jgi:hypothetical protein